MGFEQPPKLLPEEKDKKPEFYAGAKKNSDGTIDYSHAAKVILSDDEAEKIQKGIETQKTKEEVEKSLGFEWERSL